MKYSAATLTAATRPVVLTIGRVSDRRGWRRLSAWWLRAARTWTARPLSVPQMLALQADRRDVGQYRGTLETTLRAVLPRRWWYRLIGDPVRLILALPKELMEAVLKALVTVPTTTRDVSAELEDPVEIRRRAQRLAVYGAEGVRGPHTSLAHAALSVRAVYGDTWYFDPKRWPTSDGYVPFAVALLEHQGVQTLDVRRRLEVFDGTAMVHAKDTERRRRKMMELAYPAEVH